MSTLTRSHLADSRNNNITLRIYNIGDNRHSVQSEKLKAAVVETLITFLDV